MTYGIRNVIAIHKEHVGEKAPKAVLVDTSTWPGLQRKLWDYAVACHLGHALDFSVALLCYFFVWPYTFPHAATWSLTWVLPVVLFNLACEFTLNTFWHIMTYSSGYAHGPLKDQKYNPTNQYEPQTGLVRLFSIITCHLEREIFYTTLGWLQSSAYQCIMMWLWASGRIPFYDNFWAMPAYSLAQLAFVTYWREFHF